MNEDTPLADEVLKARLDAKVAPRVTEDDIRAKIATVEYVHHETTTLCIITMRNGFRVIGHSTPASAENYDSGIGQSYAYKNAFSQIWPLEGYLLRQRIADGEGPLQF